MKNKIDSFNFSKQPTRPLARQPASKSTTRTKHFLFFFHNNALLITHYNLQSASTSASSFFFFFFLLGATSSGILFAAWPNTNKFWKTKSLSAWRLFEYLEPTKLIKWISIRQAGFFGRWWLHLALSHFYHSCIFSTDSISDRAEFFIKFFFSSDIACEQDKMTRFLFIQEN